MLTAGENVLWGRYHKDYVTPELVIDSSQVWIILYTTRLCARYTSFPLPNPRLVNPVRKITCE